MNTHDKYELPPLPESRIVSYQTDSTMRSMELRTHSNEDMRDYARAAIEPYAKRIAELEADRQRRGEPVESEKPMSARELARRVARGEKWKLAEDAPQPAEPVKVPLVPDGWKLVPERIPPMALDRAVTWMGPAMREAGRDLAYCITQVWKLLLSQAPTPPAVEQPAASAEPVAWYVDWPDQPDLGHCIVEDPADIYSGRRRALVFRDAAPVAAQAQPIQWPVMPPSMGQSPVLFEDGYAEGWARCLQDCQKAVATSQQPVSGADGLPARTDAQIVAQTEELARLLMLEFYSREAPASTLFRNADDPRGRHVWKVACQAQEILTATDPENSVSTIDDEPQLAAPPQPYGNAGELPDEQEAFETAWKGRPAFPSIRDEAFWVWCQARAALAAQASGQDAQDPLQPAANWLVNDCGYAAVNVAQALRIGFNRAERMTDAARAAKEQS